jgi:hypothetical protein
MHTGNAKPLEPPQKMATPSARRALGFRHPKANALVQAVEP